MLSIYFLGKAKIRYDGEDLEEQLGSKAIALICILVLNRKRYLSREKIEGYLWPDSNTKAARYNLRYNLWLIRKKIGPDKNGNSFLHVDNECCGINSHYTFKCDIVDVMKFKTSKEDSIEDMLKLKQLFRGDLLEGCYYKKCDELNELILFERMKFEQHKARVLKRLVELYEKAKKYDECLQVINEILQLEPYDEEMVYKAMSIYQKCGKPVAAITYYNNFSELLANSLGIFPSSKLRNKYKEIKLALSDHHKSKDMGDGEKYYVGCHIKNNNELIITSHCIKDVDYFWISDVVGKIANIIGTDSVKQLNEKEILDLAYIQSDILKYCHIKGDFMRMYKKEVLSVNIINAFIKLLTYVCEGYKLTIIILNSSNMDQISTNVFKYLKRVNIDKLVLIEE